MAVITPRTRPARPVRSALSRLAERLATPLLPADYLDVIAPLLSGTRLRGRIVAIHPETRDAVTLVIQPGAGWRPHTPGQYLRLGVEVDGVRQWRCYSITSRLDRPDQCVSVTVKAIPGGLVSNYLVRRATVGTIVHLGLAAGDFVLGGVTGGAPAKVLFLTAGSGITPVMGILRNLDPDTDCDIVLVHSAPSAADVIFGGELRMLANRGRIRLIEIHTDADGMLAVDGLGALVGDLAERHTWACGPAGLLDAIENKWAEAGLADHLHTERFRPSLVALGDGGTVKFSSSAVSVEAGGSRSLLDTGEAAGVLMPSGCRMGVCFGCVAPLRRGAVRDLRTGAVTTAAEGDGVVIQTCISAAAGDCDIEL